MDDKELFMEELGYIQTKVVKTLLSKYEGEMGAEELIKEATYEAINDCIELIDGFGTKGIKYILMNSQTGCVLNENSSLHDLCESYLNYGRA